MTQSRNKDSYERWARRLLKTLDEPEVEVVAREEAERATRPVDMLTPLIGKQVTIQVRPENVRRRKA